ncbi:MAG: lytic murein transglycosylase [Candidatus Pacebacteria bacterium]|nr:lytic murein transglycosylase [Candidatus Paceibacterota bacterium]
MRNILLSFFIVALVFLGDVSLFAQTREALEKELIDLENQIKQLQGTITQTQTQKQSLSRDITVLNQKISQSKLKIQSHTKAISRLNENISEKNKTINALDAKIERGKESMAQIIRKTRFIEDSSLIAVGLQSKTLSTFFEDVDSFSTINRSLNQSFEDIRTTQKEIEEVKEELMEAKDQETEKKLAQELEKKKVETNQKEKNSLLTITKNQESQYKKVLAEREKEAGQIRAKLFELRDAGAISFGQAYDLALVASKGTGVRPALVLAILMQESSLGVNVGACYLKDSSTGEGISIKNGTSKPRTMSPTRDVSPFLDLTSRLGRDPFKTQVSCWIPMYSGGSPTGWGGAMGPSQFIPSTWKIFENRIEKITGSTLADPWNPRDAITATALYLSDLGARTGNESSERNAACKYYSGRSCSVSSAAAGYGNSVMRKIVGVQADIDKLQR